ncbi:hypothetical protein H0H81_004435 [Sphagnurus paluster]|uniref:Uncharacterized protein n=1 Tax=Sphagnurus paluster TaxID=117069 RepID=A0A9P7K296_9AGAR|nr:hypothetical protein H0H81_004435 [Sphagnurus paluster]
MGCLLKISDTLRNTVLDRDGSICPFTGARLDKADPDSVAAIILPPYAKYMSQIHVGKVGIREEDLESAYHSGKPMDMWTVPRNCIATTRKIADLLWTNELAVDVDDNYRIYYFGKTDADTPHFQTHLSPPSEAHPENRMDDAYLRAHFNFTLRRHIIADDVLSLEEAETFLEERDEEMEESGAEGYDFSDSEWATPSGVKVRQRLEQYGDNRSVMYIC